MNENVFRFVVLPIVILTVMGLTNFMRRKLARPEQAGDIQKPGKFDRFWAMVIKVLTVFVAIFTILGLVMGETEMTIAFLVLTIIFGGISILISRKFDTSYQENDDYFILKERKKEFKVYYENIVDWQPSFNEIKILDESREEDKFIPVNISMFTPEILLNKLVDRTFDGKFRQSAADVMDDPNREHEIVHFLAQNNYRYLVEDYIEKGY